jgi:hypothetical protein
MMVSPVRCRVDDYCSHTFIVSAAIAGQWIYITPRYICTLFIKPCNLDTFESDADDAQWTSIVGFRKISYL